MLSKQVDLLLAADDMDDGYREAMPQPQDYAPQGAGRAGLQDGAMATTSGLVHESPR